MARDEDYRLGRELGRGALGRVVLLERASDGAVFAGKILHESHRRDSRAVDRFRAEAVALAGLRHANVVGIFGVVEIDGEAVLCMEWVDGPGLDVVLAKDSPLPLERFYSLAEGICAGLGAAHLHGVIHRDLKPQNILVTADGIAKIADFGLARTSSYAGIDDSTFATVGTPDYLAPECVDPLAVDPRSDLYSLGCVFYEMLAGHPPFGGATPHAVMEAHATHVVPPLPDRVPPPLRDVVESMLAKSPAARPQSARAVARQLVAARAGTSGRALMRVSASVEERVNPCVRCGASRVTGVEICFECGQRLLILEKGRYGVFITGPGEAGSQLELPLRQKVLAYFTAHSDLGIDASRLAKRVPRVPFPVILGLSESCARAMAEALSACGVVVEVTRGGRYAIPAMRKKAWIMTGRMVAMMASFMYVFTHSLFHPIAGAVLAVGAGWAIAGRTSAKLSPLSTRALPEPLAQTLARLPAIVEGMRSPRHREALGGVVERVLRLQPRVPAGMLEAEWPEVIAHAVGYSVALDDIDARLAAVDLRNPDESTRDTMRARDLHASRLLELTAYLDATSSILAARDAAQEQDGLDELAAYVAALEEVEDSL